MCMWSATNKAAAPPAFVDPAGNKQETRAEGSFRSTGNES